MYILHYAPRNGFGGESHGLAIVNGEWDSPPFLSSIILYSLPVCVFFYPNTQVCDSSADTKCPTCYPTPLLQGEINEELLLIDYCHVEIHTHPTAFPQCTTQRVFKLLHIREHWCTKRNGTLISSLKDDSPIVQPQQTREIVWRGIEDDCPLYSQSLYQYWYAISSSTNHCQAGWRFQNEPLQWCIIQQMEFTNVPDESDNCVLESPRIHRHFQSSPTPLDYQHVSYYYAFA